MMDFTQLNDGSENRGQVGIGTLIVFIAMVLVAAIAAGVLVNTAGFLQATAEETGQESVDQVTQRLDVINEHGTVGTGDNVKSINLTVGLSSGSDAVNLENTTIKYVSDGSVATLTYNDTSTSGTEFNANEVNGDNANAVLTDTGDRYALQIGTNEIEGSGGADEGLSAGDTVQLEITTGAGGTTTAVLTMPDQLADSTNDEPVPL